MEEDLVLLQALVTVILALAVLTLYQTVVLAIAVLQELRVILVVRIGMAPVDLAVLPQ